MCLFGGMGGTLVANTIYEYVVDNMQTIMIHILNSGIVNGTETVTLCLVYLVLKYISMLKARMSLKAFM